MTVQDAVAEHVGGHQAPGGDRTRVPEGLALRYGILYGSCASDAMLEAVRKRQIPIVGGGTGIWSFTEVTDAAAATVAATTAPWHLQRRG